LLWVKSYYYDKIVSTDDTVTDVKWNRKRKGYVTKGDFLINLAAMPIKGNGKYYEVSEIE
jgi:pyruvate kinase